MRKFALLAIVAISFSGCYQQLEVIDIDGFSNVEITLRGMKSDMQVEVYNPNFMSVEIVDAEVVLKLGEVEAGDVTLMERVKLAAGDTVVVNLKVATRQGALGQLLKRGSMLFTADGVIVGKAWGMKMEIPVHHEQDLSE
jgi:LEA14-like dessication related protein